MSYTYHGTTDLIALPERGVQTFPSGLVRIDRTYVCRKGLESTHRETLAEGNPLPLDDGAPAIDGVYIFPTPQEIVGDDGFVQFRVSAYGRSQISQTDNFTKSIISGTYSTAAYSSKSVVGADIVSIIIPRAELPSLNELYVLSFVAPSSESSSAALASPLVSNPVIIDRNTGLALVPGEVRSQPFTSGSSIGPTIESVLITTTTITLRLESYQCLNFGRWMEYSSSWQAFGTVSRVQTVREL